MEYLIEPFSAGEYETPESPKDEKMQPETPEIGKLASWPQYYPLYGIQVPFKSERD